MSCDDCKTKNSCRFNWHNVCCRVRFLLSQTNRQARQLWCARWRKKGEADMVAKVVEKLKRMA